MPIEAKEAAFNIIRLALYGDRVSRSKKAIGAKNKRRGPKTPIRANDPLLRELFQLIEAEGFSREELCARAGVTKTITSKWRNGHHSPRLDMITAYAQAAGYRLKLEKIDKPAK